MTTVTVGPRANAALLGSCHRDVGQGPVWVPLLRWSQQRPNRREMWQKETSVTAGLAGSRHLRGGGLSPRWEVRQGTRGKPRLIECVGPVRCLYEAVKQAVRHVSRGLVVAQRTGCSWTWSLQCGSRSHSRAQVGLLVCLHASPGSPGQATHFFYKFLSPVSRLSVSEGDVL